MKEKLIEICKGYTLPADIEVVIREPYIPHIPSDWNGILVLAESQNLSGRDEGYPNYLQEIGPDKRIDRLNLDANSIGVGPWDDGSLKLALESAYEHESSEKTAISNAALWSQREGSGANANPDDDVQQYSSVIWKAMLEVMKPKLVICSGNIAESVIGETGWAGETIKWRLPAWRGLNLSGKMDLAEVLECYPEVQRALKKGKFKDIADDKHAHSQKLFFAFNSVSRTVDGCTVDNYRAK